MSSALVIVVGVVGGVVLLVAALALVAGRRQASLRESARAEVLELLGGAEPRRIDDQVNCFGLESRGMAQVRGTGCLAATGNEVVFVLWYPRRTLCIDRSEIVGIDTPTSHLGKSRARPLLRIRFTIPTGEEDAIAWWVRDLAGWLDELGAVPAR
jgi:hypothetical protein